MDIAASAQALLAAVTQPAASTPAPTAEPSALATERFNAIMNAPDANAADAAQSAAQSTTLQAAFAAQAPGNGQPVSLGNQILSGMQSTATQVSQQWDALAGSIDRLATHPNVGDMLQVQAQLVQAEVQYSLVSKAVSKATSNIDTLVRMS